MKNGVVKLPCKCHHEMQDEIHGKGVRVFNTTAKQDKDFVDVRCTVCGAIQRVRPERIK